ncbi:M60 family metallopeptidase [Neisseriaceae bacterium JH1-16]|nr:M60 family metallopeptidase [Neisseriaceae bacterium JH1-16]
MKQRFFLSLVAVLTCPAWAQAINGDMLISASRGWCAARTSDGVSAAPCDGGDPHQRWIVDAAALHPADSLALCLSGKLAERGGLALASCDGGAAQHWAWAENALLNGDWALSLSPDNALEVSTKRSTIAQRWERLSELAVEAGRAEQVSYPIAATDSAAIELERARHVVNQLTPPDKPLPAPRDVRHFPGAVPVDAPRLTVVVPFNRHFTRAFHIGWSQKPRNWLATGLYAPAGETITVSLLDDARTDGVSLRIGPHTDVIERSKPGETILRYARVSLSVPLHPGINRVRSQYGGLVILESAVSADVTLPVTIAGAVEAPHFKLGTHSDADWAVSRDAPAPWAVLEGQWALLVVPSSQVRALANPQSVMQAYDTAQQAVMDLAGFNGSSPLHPRLQGKQWLVEDLQISHGYGHADFPIMTVLDWKLASVDAGSNWGVIHESGHNYQQTCLWAERYGIESTVNLYPLYVAEVIRHQPALIDTKSYSKAIAKLHDGIDFDRDTDQLDKLVFLAQLRYAFPELGWDIFRQLNRRYRELSADQQASICASPQRQVDTLYELLSDITGHDLTAHFRHWGVPISAEAVARVEARGLPLPAADTWRVNPELMTQAAR